MLQFDSLVTDLIFQKNAQLDLEPLVAALGGEEAVANCKIIDPDMQDPRFEMELSPSQPFRRRGERRLMIVDEGTAPLREDPRADPIVPLDLRPARTKLIALCESLDIRLGRLNVLGSHGDAVLVARSAVELRAIALVFWVLSPVVDADGNQRSTPLTRPEFEAKVAAYPKRLEELDEAAILANLNVGRFERHGELLVVDVLEADGTWDMRNSMALESCLAAVDQFSLIPGAPSAGGNRADDGQAEQDGADAGAEAVPADDPPEAAPAAPATPPARAVAPLRIAEVAGRTMLIFPDERFDLDVAAALGKGDFESVLTPGDPVDGPIRDAIYRDGADFVAPLEFLSEVFVDGKPLSRPDFERDATEHDGGIRTLEVHCPRYGRALLIVIPEHGRFICSRRDALAEVAALLTSSAG